MNPLLLVSATYEQPNAVLKFYDPKTEDIVTWHDNTNHKPYCYSKLDKKILDDLLGDRDDIISIEEVVKTDLILDQQIKVCKITCADPLTISGSGSYKSIRNFLEIWEGDIKYHECYLYDKNLVVGKYYQIEDDQIKPYEFEQKDVVIQDTSDGMVDREAFKQYVKEWTQLLNQPVPKIKRLSVDIEVEAEIGNLPDPLLAEKKITAVGMEGNDGLKIVLVLKREGRGIGENKMPEGVKIIFFDPDKEKQMIEFAFGIMEQYPFVLTFNGDQFDLPYMFNRAQKYDIDTNMFIQMRDSVTLKRGIHIDLFKVFSNKAYQIYTFNNKYSDYSLNSISLGLLGEEKIKNDDEISVLRDFDLARYCFNDARLTLKLTTFDNDVLMKILVITTRIARLPIDTISRFKVSQWIKSLLSYEHRRNNAIIPRRVELDTRTVKPKEEAMIDGKKYKGALVLEPKPGIHFDVTTLDFGSLYPSIVKMWNVSYETIRCSHEECQTNVIPLTEHWTCGKRNGVVSMAIGSLRDLRLYYYKSLAKKSTGEEKELYDTISQTLKVFLNASYGVLGAEIFSLFYLPAAETVTAVGRETISKSIAYVESLGVDVLASDTDSIFVKNFTKEQIEMIMEEAKTRSGIDIEVDKEYRYVVLSTRKKNYFGVKKDGKFDIKGLTAKKSHTPQFLKKLFNEIKTDLIKVNTMEDFVQTKKDICKKMSSTYTLLKNRTIPLEELTFNIVLSKEMSEYTKTTPQHIKAALQLKKDVKKGDIISYIKVLGKTGVKPTTHTRRDEIDVNKYVEFMQTMMEQIIEPMGLGFEESVGLGKQVSIAQFF